MYLCLYAAESVRRGFPLILSPPRGRVPGRADSCVRASHRSTTVKKHTLNAESLKVETFVTFTDQIDVAGTCICDAAPCICSKAPDCVA